MTKMDIIEKNGKTIIWSKFVRKEKIKLAILCFCLGVFTGFVVSAILYFILFPPKTQMYIVVK